MTDLCELHRRGKQKFGWFSCDINTLRKQFILGIIVNDVLYNIGTKQKRLERKSLLTMDKELSEEEKEQEEFADKEITIEEMNETMDYVYSLLNKSTFELAKERPDVFEIYIMIVLKEIFSKQEIDEYIYRLNNKRKITKQDIILITAIWLIDIYISKYKKPDKEIYLQIAFVMILDATRKAYGGSFSTLPKITELEKVIEQTKGYHISGGKSDKKTITKKYYQEKNLWKRQIYCQPLYNKLKTVQKVELLIKELEKQNDRFNKFLKLTHKQISNILKKWEKEIN